MRMIPTLAGLMLIAGAASAQPPPDQGQMPGPQMGDQMGQGGGQPPPGQMPPPGGQQAPYGQSPYGQSPPGGAPPRSARVPFRQKFEAANVTRDGKLTLDQARAGHLGMVVHHFAEMDTERKGYVTMQDVRTWRTAMRQARSGQGQGQGQGPAPAVTPPPPDMSGPPQ